MSSVALLAAGRVQSAAAPPPVQTANVFCPGGTAPKPSRTVLVMVVALLVCTAASSAVVVAKESSEPARKRVLHSVDEGGTVNEMTPLPPGPTEIAACAPTKPKNASATSGSIFCI